MRRVVLGLLTLVACSSAAHAQTKGAWADKLFGGVTAHDFGVIAQGTQVKHSFKMTNIYKVPLTIMDVRVSCSRCGKAESSVKVLQPNETAMLHTYMDARHFVGHKTITIYVMVGPQYVSTATLTVSANARGDIVFSPNEVDFGTVQQNVKASRSIDVEYTGTLLNWQLTEIVKSGASPFDLKVEQLPIGPKGVGRRGYRITATMKPDAPVGSFKQEVTLKTSDLSNPSLTFGVSGNVQASLAITPDLVAVKGLRVGESQTKKIFVKAPRPFRVTGVDGQGDGVTVDVPDRETQEQVLTVRIQPTRAGELSRQMTIRTNLDNGTVRLNVEGMIEP